MEDNNNDFHEKKLSRKTLTFYIVALFSVAIALIMISYVAQSRANEKVANLSSQLNEQQSAVQGVAKKMDDLQRRFDEQTTVLENMRTELGTEQAKTDIAGAVKTVKTERDIYQRFVKVYSLMLTEQMEEAFGEFKAMQAEYGEDKLGGTADDSYSEEIVLLYKSTQEMLIARIEAAQGE